ncbi:PREDICTED: probable 28S ribosomal protein S26, mitochondrial [Nicrophorus vespilloides]|uniref:Small ribosomal subunit protein mS26 n=1 Tax=Nicrophorus vespilloides TaxID=110193 RepID=A0ABM1NCE1_NICVS|nr:PREDICTED: probable 28S ribosomal protein S26, mitochondrial [Nicrophorus vespilloides]
MLRVLNCLKGLQLGAEALSPNPTLQTVRWRRKPRWIPKARSKLFKIPEIPKIPKEENDELARLFNNYRTQMKSIRRHFTYKYCTHMQKTENLNQKLEEEADLRRCIELNDKWNVEVKKTREARIAADIEKEVELAEDRVLERQRINAEKLEEAEKLVREQKAVAHTFITSENIDEAIDKAISNEVDYNFSIDLEGNKYMGRTKSPDEEKIAVKQ